MVELDRKLAAVLEGKEKPADDAERIALAQLCQQPFKKRYAAAARFYGEAFAAEPALAEKLGAAGGRYDAACTAALAGCGRGDDAPADEADRAACGRSAGVAAVRPGRLEAAAEQHGFR